MVLSAGRGSRLEPLTTEVPKPLVPLGDRPLLDHLAAALAEAAPKCLVFNTHYLADKIVAFAKGWGARVQVSEEKGVLGTAGGVAFAYPRCSGVPWIVQNGDIWGASVAPALLETDDSADLVLSVVRRPKGRGTVGLGDDGRVVRLRGEVFGLEVSGADYRGTMRLLPRALEALPSVGCLIGDVALPALRRGQCIGALISAEPFVDIGSLPEYLRANQDWLGQVGAEGEGYRGGHVSVGPGVELERCVLGEGVLVQGEGLVSEVVAWPGATVVAPLSRAIVTPTRVVPVGGP